MKGLHQIKITTIITTITTIIYDIQDIRNDSTTTFNKTILPDDVSYNIYIYIYIYIYIEFTLI